MSKHEQTFQLPVAPETALLYCQEVSNEMGWRVLEVSRQGISIKEVSPQVTSFTWPARIDVKIQNSNAGNCVIQLFGSVTGMGPIQRNHLQGQMGRFLNALSIHVDKKSAVPAQQPTSSANSVSLAEELGKLHELFEKGILSADEFAAAKTRLLG